MSGFIYDTVTQFWFFISLYPTNVKRIHHITQSLTVKKKRLFCLVLLWWTWETRKQLTRDLIAPLIYQGTSPHEFSKNKTHRNGTGNQLSARRLSHRFSLCFCCPFFNIKLCVQILILRHILITTKSDDGSGPKVSPINYSAMNQKE